MFDKVYDFFKPSLKKLAKTNKNLNELTTNELLEFLKKNNDIDALLLGPISAEVLRRLLKFNDLKLE